MKHLWSMSLVLLALAILSACPAQADGDGDSDGDGDIDGDGDGDTDLDIEPPETARLPTFTPCPPGWREVPGEGPDSVTTCDPWPEGGPHDCADDEAHFPGEPGCSRIGSACPVGDWAADLPAGVPVIYVLDDAPASGEGSQSAPFATIAQAMAAADNGTVIALSKGTFDEAVELRGGVTLWGACVAETLVTCSQPFDDFGTITVNGLDTAVRNLRVSGERPGIVANGAVGELELTVEDVLVDGAWGPAGFVAIGALVTGRSLVVRGTRTDADGLFGRGLFTRGGADVDVTRASFDQNHDIGVSAYEEDTRLVLNDVAIGNTLSDANGAYGGGLHADSGSFVDVTRASFDRNRSVGVFAGHEGTGLILNEVVIRDTLSNGNGEGGVGLAVLDGADGAVTRAVFVENTLVGVGAANEGVRLALTDVVIQETQCNAAGVDGAGLVAEDSAEVELTRAVIEQNRETGAVALGAGTTLTFTDLVVRKTEPNDTGRGGRGLEAVDGAGVWVTRASFEENLEAGIFAADEGTSLVLADIVVRGTQSDRDGLYGRGLEVQWGASVEIDDALFERNRDSGVFGVDPGTTVTMTDVVVLETLEQGCAVDACAGEGAGHGVVARNQAHIDARRFRISHSALCGVQLAFDGTMDLHEGEVSHNLIGANVQTEGFDWDRLLDEVVFDENDRDFDSIYMPVPEPALPEDLTGEER